MGTIDGKVASHPVLHRVLEDAGTVQGKVEQQRAEQILAKQDLFPQLEENGDHRLIAYLTGPAMGGIDLSDAAPLGSMLDAIGTCETLDLMLNSPGGIGESAEKIVEMCRAHCSEFRVIVPNFAKSAATMIALGADVILMGYLSELGPTDPQYTIAVGDMQQFLSGQSFISAYTNLHERVNQAISNGENPTGLLQSLSTSTMEPAFIDHCERGVELSRDIARRFLQTHQLPALDRAKDLGLTDDEISVRACNAADNLLSAHTRFSHGRLIGAQEAQDVGLHVQELERDDAKWEAYWELYVRAEVYMQTLSSETPVTKLFFDRKSTLPVYEPVM